MAPVWRKFEKPHISPKCNIEEGNTFGHDACWKCIPKEFFEMSFSSCLWALYWITDNITERVLLLSKRNYSAVRNHWAPKACLWMTYGWERCWPLKCGICRKDNEERRQLRKKWYLKEAGVLSLKKGQNKAGKSQPTYRSGFNLDSLCR